MRWMTRYVGFIARPIVQIYAENEVIACGIRDSNGGVSAIFTPISLHREHKAFVLRDRRWESAASYRGVNFSGSYVHRVELPEAKVDEHYKVKAIKRNGRSISSPVITIKKETVYDASLMKARILAEGKVLFAWENAEIYAPMIYFLVIENREGKTCAAIYTREHFWTYPNIKKASYSVGPPCPPALALGGQYVAKLALVDFDGWVSHMTELQFDT